MPPKSKLANDADMTSTLLSLNKWLKAQNLSLMLDIPGQDMPDCIRLGVQFLDALRSSRHFPGRITYGESTLLRVIEELSSKADHSSHGAVQVPSNAARAPQGREEKENIVPKGKVKKTVKKLEDGKDASKAEKPGPKSKKLAPLAAAQNQQPKGCGCKGECKTKVCGCQKRKIMCDSHCKCLESCVIKVKRSEKKPEPEPESESEEEEEEEEQEQEERKKSPKNANIAGNETDDELSDEEQLNGGGSDDGTETVDWDEHIASLVTCKKCKRKFFPARIIRHEEVCKNN